MKKSQSPRRRRTVPGSGGYLSARALARVLPRVRRKRTVVFANGCFDLLHSGHLRLFRRAKAAGDILVVALNSDASVRRLKGRSRPLVALGERADLVGALRPVDFVTSFGEPTPAKIIALLRPDVVVKGADWSADRIVGREVARRVLRVPLVKGRSTTRILSRILKKLR